MEPARTGARTAGAPTDTAMGSSTSRPDGTRPSALAPRAGTRRSPRDRIPPSTAVVARPMLVLLPVATFLLPALLLAMLRTPTYKAEARLIVGGFDVQAQAVPGFVEAARTLAETYSRLVSTPAIEGPAAEASGLDADLVAGGIHATAVPESSIIRVIGEADNKRDAIRLADAAAEALVAYANGDGSNASSTETLKEYQDASRELAAAQEAADTAQGNLDVVEAGGSVADIQAARDTLATARAAVAAAELRQSAIGDRYSESESGSGSTVAVVSPATDAGSDRRSTVQLAIAAPVLLGLVVGTALATVVVNRPVARREPDA
jgi:hypothetical protein